MSDKDDLAARDICADVATALRRADIAREAGWVRADQAEVVLAREVRRLQGEFERTRNELLALAKNFDSARMTYGKNRQAHVEEVNRLKALLPVFARFDSFASLMQGFYALREHLRDEIKAQPSHATGLQYAVDRLDEVLGPAAPTKVREVPIKKGSILR